MAITLDATAANTGYSVDTVTISSFTGTTGTLIRVDTCSGSDHDCTGVTYNGVSLTKVADTDQVGVLEMRVASFIGITGPDGAAHDVVVTWATNPATIRAARVSTWAGVEMSSVAASHRTVYLAGDSVGGGVDVTVVDSQSGDVVVSITQANHTSITAVETLLGANNNIAGDGRSFGVQYKTATGANTVMAWADDTFNTHVAYALVPSGTTPPEGPKLRVVRSVLRTN